MAVRYELPSRFMRYDLAAIASALIDAKAAVQALVTTPFQRSWVEKLQEVQLKMEVAGTSRIEGAEFSDAEFEDAVTGREAVEALLTRSQRQARCAMETYRWISDLPLDYPITEQLIKKIHSSLVTGCDDDHCPPGALRKLDENVLFGVPRHRGCEGGPMCELALSALVSATNGEFKDHDLLVQALAFHYHFGSMHPFLDGNGRTARALEALMLQRAGLRDSAFIAMSNYYYDEKASYLAALTEVRAQHHDLTPFLVFGLRGIARQCERLFKEIRKQMQKALFRNTMFDLFNRLESTRKSYLGKRQVHILKTLLEAEEMKWSDLRALIMPNYNTLRSPAKAMVRDVNNLIAMKSISVRKGEDGKLTIRIRLEWPSEITESEFFRQISEMPKRKSIVQL
jgi:Fic family protein